MAHESWCNYPSGPCDCGYNKPQRRHSSWCGYPNEPCDCGQGLSKADRDAIRDGRREDKLRG